MAPFKKWKNFGKKGQLRIVFKVIKKLMDGATAGQAETKDRL